MNEAEIKRKAVELKLAIMDLIEEFEEQTGCYVESLHHSYIGGLPVIDIEIEEAEN